MTVTLLLAFAQAAHGLNLDPIWADKLASVTFLGAFDPPYSPAQVIASVQEYSPDKAPASTILGAYRAWVAGWSQFSHRSLSLLSALVPGIRGRSISFCSRCVRQAYRAFRGAGPVYEQLRSSLIS